jgi:hypothetical protein
LRRFQLAALLGITFAICGIANAAENASIFGGIGIAWPERIDGTWYYTGGVRWSIHGNWALEGDYGYWKQEDVVEECNAAICPQYDIEDQHVGGSILWTGPFSIFDMYTGGGLAAHFQKRDSAINRPEPVFASADKTYLGIQILQGADFPNHTPLAVTIAVREDFIFREDPFDDQWVIMLYGGLRYRFW